MTQHHAGAFQLREPPPTTPTAYVAPAIRGRSPSDGIISTPNNHPTTTKPAQWPSTNPRKSALIRGQNPVERRPRSATPAHHHATDHDPGIQPHPTGLDTVPTQLRIRGMRRRSRFRRIAKWFGLLVCVVIAAGAVAADLPTIILWRRDRRPPEGHCQTCGYNLTGNTSGRCPECGHTT